MCIIFLVVFQDVTDNFSLILLRTLEHMLFAWFLNFSFDNIKLLFDSLAISAVLILGYVCFARLANQELGCT